MGRPRPAFLVAGHRDSAVGAEARRICRSRWRWGVVPRSDSFDYGTTSTRVPMVVQLQRIRMGAGGILTQPCEPP